MAETYIFKRLEKKYRINEDTCRALLDLIGEHLEPDPYGKSTICSLYLDTPSFLLIRNSIDAKGYKEKLRLRSYGIPSPDTKVFLELKKKYKGVVYKRRVKLHLQDALDYIQGGEPPKDSQIMREIDYAMTFYGHPKPAMLIAYERDAYYASAYPGLRITFDRDLRYLLTDRFPEKAEDGERILPPDQIIMEIKTDGGMPLFLTKALDACGILPSSFSKYGRSYLKLLDEGRIPAFPKKPQPTPLDSERRQHHGSAVSTRP